MSKRDLDGTATSLDPRHFTQQERKDIVESLAMKLGPEFMSHRSGPGGSKLTYLEGWKSINLANDIFGFDGWSSSVIDQTVDFLDNENGKYSLGVSAIVRVTLKDGTFHEDVGYGSIENSRSKIAAFEKAKKEAITDSLKRALRSFGNSLGNCFYDKDYMKKISKLKVPKQRPLCEDDLYRHKDFYTGTSDHPARQSGSDGIPPPQQGLPIQNGPHLPLTSTVLTTHLGETAPELHLQPTTTGGIVTSRPIAAADVRAPNCNASNTLPAPSVAHPFPQNASYLNSDQLDDEMNDDDDLFLMAADMEYVDSSFLTGTPTNLPRSLNAPMGASYTIPGLAAPGRSAVHPMNTTYSTGENGGAVNGILGLVECAPTHMASYSMANGGKSDANMVFSANHSDRINANAGHGNGTRIPQQQQQQQQPPPQQQQFKQQQPNSVSYRPATFITASQYYPGGVGLSNTTPTMMANTTSSTHSMPGIISPSSRISGSHNQALGSGGMAGFPDSGYHSMNPSLGSGTPQWPNPCQIANANTMVQPSPSAGQVRPPTPSHTRPGGVRMGTMPRLSSSTSMAAGNDNTSTPFKRVKITPDGSALGVAASGTKSIGDQSKLG
ncbi:hypothetical protein BASA61_004118 [Batrachochytrium salamandrivorans]|nr:hypothetical protein BASA61_004118 [Batrachochytrium salamandrivorans]